MRAKMEFSLVNESAVRSLEEQLEQTLTLRWGSLRSWEGASRLPTTSNPSRPLSAREPIRSTTGETAIRSRGGWRPPFWI